MRSIFFHCSVALLGLSLAACSNADAPAKDSALTATTPASGEATTITERNANNRLKETLSKNLNAAGIKANITAIRATELPQLYWVSLEGMPSVYTTLDGKYIIQGDVVRLEKNNVHNISEDLQAGDTKALLATVDLKDTITYKATGSTKAVVYVFTDASCPYCHKLHEEMSGINAKGIEVRYLAWPRAEQFLPLMSAIWCSEDRIAAFDSANKNLPVNAPECKNPVMKHHALGVQIGVNGTPAIYSVDGKYLGGYMTAAELAKKLGL
jgi:thiol:disulfide interchange protein DsbC